MSGKLISIVIAVYQNENALSITHQKIVDLFKTQLTDFNYEIIFVDDGSKDNSLTELMNIKQRDAHARIITFTRNFGQMAAMVAGFRHASGDAVINISADLQDPIELIAQMIQQWHAGNETVICYRIEREDPFTQRITSKIAYSLMRLTVPQIPPGGFDYVLMDRKVIDSFVTLKARNRFFQGDIIGLGYRISFIPYKRMKRTIGKSQYTFWKKVKILLDAILDASYLPIRFISALGIVTAFSGFAYMIVIVISWALRKTPFVGWAPIMVAVLVVGGLTMTMLGIIGEYVWRIYDEVRNKPMYIIRDKIF